MTMMGEAFHQFPPGQPMDSDSTPLDTDFGPWDSDWTPKDSDYGPSDSDGSSSVLLADDASPFDLTKMLEDAYNEKLTKAQWKRLREVLRETDSKELTAEQSHLIYQRTFRFFLKKYRLRSPDYYRDKSQFISFENVSPAERAAYKCQALAFGYVDPMDLTEKLKKLKRSSDFTLPRYRHPAMTWWSKSPIISRTRLRLPPDPDWLVRTLSDLDLLSRQGRLGERQTEIYEKEMVDYWEKVRDIELIPLPDLHLLKDMGHSPSGTLLPTYLVKGLHYLRTRADRRGAKYYTEEYGKAKIKRKETIRRWRDEHPDSILAVDPPSIYKTWPTELMTQLNALDQAAMLCGNKHYIDDLLMTEKEMQKLLSFWKECGLITGTRTPPSPIWPDPKAKFRSGLVPPYLCARIATMFSEFKDSKEFQKRRFFEISRWKEAAINTDAINTDTDYSPTSAIPLTPSLLKELEVAWQNYKTFEDSSDVEDDMIAKIGQRRKPKHGTALSGRHRMSSQTAADVGTESMADKRTPGNSVLRLSRSDSIALKEASYFLRTMPQKRTQSRSGESNSTAKENPWSGRLRPKPTPEKSSRPLLKAPRKLSGRPQGILKLGSRESSKKLR